MRKLLLALSLVVSLQCISLPGAIADDAQCLTDFPTELARNVKDVNYLMLFKASEINTRSGPGVRFCVKRVVKDFRGPVKITGEYEAWRRIEIDDGGYVAWVNKGLLSFGD